MMWESTAEDLLLCNSFCLEHNFIYFCHSNLERVAQFGHHCFDRDWSYNAQTENAIACAIYSEDVMTPEVEDLTDLSSPLLWGCQDIRLLPPDAQHYAKRYPNFLLPIPKDADPRLPQWRANIMLDKVALYSWPTCDRKDLSPEQIPFAHVSPLHQEFDKLIAQHFAEATAAPPTGIVMRAQLVVKTKTTKRFTVNGSVQKQCMQVSAYPMPRIREIFQFVSRFPWRVKLDLLDGYHNMEVHPEDRKFTITIGAGRCIQWRKCVQGFASTGSFFQWAMEKILGPKIIMIIAAVYLDDLIIVGNTAAECTRNLHTVLDILYSLNFRISFKKCMFTPSQTISFLGCTLVGNVVHPGPKVAVALAKIQPFYAQKRTKDQRSHLYSFLGLCAFLDAHKLGLKQQLHPLYSIVAKEPFIFDDSHVSCFDKAFSMLLELDVYFLPSQDPAYRIELCTDASGGMSGDGIVPESGHWAAVLGQRRGVPNPVYNEGFELLQIAGGSFNTRQGNWAILIKEMFAIYMGFLKFEQFLRGRHVLLITDSKVLLHCFRSTNPMIRRWYTYIQSFEFDVIHWPSSANQICDCLTRTVSLHEPLVAHHNTSLPLAPSTLAVIDSHPAPSLLRCGDIESQPGPPRSNRFIDRVLQVRSSSSESSLPESSDDAPLVSWQLSTSAPIDVLSSSSPHRSGSDDTPMVAIVTRTGTTTTPQPPRSRRNTGRSPPTTPSLAAPAIPSQPSLVAPFPSALPSPAIAPQPSLVALSPVALPSPAPRVRFLSAAPPSPAQPPASASPQSTSDFPHDVGAQLPSVLLRTHSLRRDSNSFFTSVGMALAHSNAADAPLSVNIRESVIQFISDNASDNFALLDDHSFKFCIRRDYVDARPPCVVDFTGGHQASPRSFREWLHAMIQPDTFPDATFIKATALHLDVQIILINDASDCCPIGPSTAYRRIFLRVSNVLFFSWCHLESELCSDDSVCSVTPTFTITFPLTLLATKHLGCEPPPLHVNAERARLHHLWLSQAHCGHTGHPGVDATIRLLKMQRHEWRGITKDTAAFIKRCPTCTLNAIRHNPALTSVSSLRTTDRPLTKWHIDQAYLPECSHTGFKFMIVFVCEITGYVYLAGSRHRTSLEVAIALLTVCGLFGTADTIHTDGGSEFDSDVLQQFAAIAGFKHSMGIARAPNTNGIAERNIGTVKRFLRSLVGDIGRHNCWGLLLPIVQKATNDLPRQSLGCSPNQFVFASLTAPSLQIIPVVYHRQPSNDVASANAHRIASNFAERALCFQQAVTNRFTEHLDLLMQQSIDNAVAPLDDLLCGMQVLLPWPGEEPPTALHPRYRGPYRIVHKRRNVLHLEHVHWPLPVDQPANLSWSAHAFVYSCDLPFARSSDDPSAAQMSLSSPALAIDCIIQHRLHPAARPRSSTVEDFQYLVRFHGTSAASQLDQGAWKDYVDVRHSMAFDSYAIAHPFITDHTPISFMPANWDPYLPPPSLRPAHEALPLSERHIPLHEAI
jgi:transposase InsO family protein